MTSSQRREAIVDAAVQLFAQNGFRGTTTRQIAAAVGVSEPVLYMHFETKSELYTAIIEKVVGGCGEGRVLPDLSPANDDRRFLVSLAMSIVDWHEADPGRVRLLFYSALEGHELSDIFYTRHVVPFLEAFSRYVQQRIREGAFRKVDPHLAARTFINMVVKYGADLVIFRKAADTGANRKKTIEAMVDIFLNGVKK
jgi:AcrR family transcriptional regulator